MTTVWVARDSKEEGGLVTIAFRKKDIVKDALGFYTTPGDDMLCYKGFATLTGATIPLDTPPTKFTLTLEKS